MFDSFQDVRILVVRPHWEWDSDGFFGSEPSRGVSQLVYWQIGGDTTTQTFISNPIPIPPGFSITQLQVRAWVWNGWGVWSDDDTWLSY